jgi:hypothetical protein
MTDEQLKTLFQTIYDKMVEMSARIKVLEADKAAPQTSSYKEEVMSDEKAEFKSVEDAPVWNVYYKVNTSEGIYKTKVQQQAWTEKQSIYLARTEQLFKHMSEKVKAKEIEAKWSILESVSEKIN